MFSRPIRGEASVEMRFQVKADDSDDGVRHFWRLSPLSNDLMPYLANIAANYRSYTMKSIRFDFEPSTNTAVNGFMLMGFTPSCTCEKPSLTELQSWQCQSQSQCYMKNSLTIVPGDTSQKKVGEFMLVPDDSDQYVASPSLYELGSFCIRTRRSDTADETVAGNLRVTYNFAFKDRTTDAVSQTAAAVYEMGSGWRVISPGIMGLHVNEETEALNASISRPVDVTYFSKASNAMAYGTEVASRLYTATAVAGSSFETTVDHLTQLRMGDEIGFTVDYTHNILLFFSPQKNNKTFVELLGAV